MMLRTAFLWTTIVSLGLAAGLGIMALLFPSTPWLDGRIIGTTLLVGLFSLPALACTFVLSQRRAPALMWVGVIASLVALIGWLVVVWFEGVVLWQQLEQVIRWNVVPTTLAVACAHGGLLSILPIVNPVFRVVRSATIVLACAVAAILIGASVLNAFDDASEIFFLSLSVLSILLVFGTLATPILSMIEMFAGKTRETLPSRLRLSLTCPRCRSVQELAPGTSHCATCRLKFFIEVQEPRCACGYLLYHLASETCPECGRAVNAEDRWLPNEPAAQAEGHGVQ